MKILSVLSLFCLSPMLLAQSATVVPNSVSTFGVSQTGNFVSSQCDGNNPKFFKVSIIPSCYGANLRGGGSVLDPNGEAVVMKLKVSNGGASFLTDVKVPIEVTWPESHGTSCDWKVLGTNHSVTCPNGDKKVSYSCTYKKEDFFLNDNLQCVRAGDPVREGENNKKIGCTFFYNWKGTDYAATNSYTRLNNIANCGIIDSLQDLKSKVAVTGGLEGKDLTVYATKGKVVLASDDANVPHRKAIIDLRTKEVIPQGQESVVEAEFFQGTRKLTYKLEKSYDVYEQCLTIKPSFLGANQFCGSYYSPLMLFFSSSLPKFVGRSSFPLYGNVPVVAWPEANASGYFLVHDSSKKGTVNSGKQLFGNSNGFKNGFEQLKQHDQNKDFMINSSDKIFTELYLWNDANGNGISDKGEVVPLAAMNVGSISLYYNENEKISFGPSAEAREKSSFVFVKDGKKITSTVYDIWLAPIK